MDLFNQIFESLTEAVSDQMGVDKERIDYLQEAIVTRVVEKIKKKESTDIRKMVTSSGLEMIDHLVHNREPLTFEETAVLGMSTPIIVSKVVDRLHEINGSHNCETCLAEYICGSDKKRKNESK